MSSMQFGPFLIDLEERVLRRDGQLVPLTPKAFDVLAALAEEPGRLVSKDELLRKVWPDTFVEESNLAYHIFTVRKALGDTATTPRYIETVPKRGYRFSAVVTLPPVDIRGASTVTGIITGPVEAVSAPSAGPNSPAEPAAELPSSRTWALVALAPVLGAVWYVTGPLSRAPADSNAMRALPLTSLTGVVSSPSLSPDGRYVVFTWNGATQDNQDLYVQQIGAGSPLRLTSDPAHDYSPSWSPDGRTIAFLRRYPAGRGIEVRLMAPLGGAERKVADIEPGAPAYRPHALAWCPDNSCIVTTDTTGRGQPDAIVAISVDTGEKRRLTKPEGLAADVDPAISPDGRHLIFRRDTTPFSGRFYRQPLNGHATPEGLEVSLTSTILAGKPVWMPDSREVLFPHRGGLWRMDAVGGGAATRLPFVGQDGVSPVVARVDGQRQRLIYVRSFGDTNVWRVDWQPGSAAVNAPVSAIASTRIEVIPNLSPDGRRLVFLSDRSGDLQLWSAGPDGGDAVQLTSMEFRSMPGFPRWSPDGTTITFHGDPEGRPEVLVVPVRGGKPRSLTSSLPNGGFPSFSRDGRWIYFCVVDAGEPRIWKIPSAGGPPILVTHNAGTLAIESVDGRDLFYNEATPGPSAIWRQPLAGGPPEKILDRVANALFDVTDGGIFYVERVSGQGAAPADRPDGGTQLQYYDFATRRSSIVAQNLGSLAFGLTASPDGRTVFFSRVDSSANELMIVDSFR